MQKKLFLTVVMFLIGMLMTGAYAQTHTVSGLVKDKEMGDRLSGKILGSFFSFIVFCIFAL